MFYNRTERDRGFFICSSKLNLKNIAEHNLGTFSINSPENMYQQIKRHTLKDNNVRDKSDAHLCCGKLVLTSSTSYDPIVFACRNGMKKARAISFTKQNLLSVKYVS